MAGRDCGVLADVGCDHAGLGIGLLLDGAASRLIASDLREGPLRRAKENITLAGCDDKAQTRISDGLAAFTPGEADTIVIAGMGGVLMTGILKKGIEVARSARQLILSPHSHADTVREWLTDCGFDIIDEDICMDGAKTYVVIKAVYTPGKELAALTSAAALFGPVLMQKKPPLLREYAQSMLLKAQRRLAQINKGEDPAAREKFEVLLKASQDVINLYR